MTIINSPHILLCSRGKLCLQATLFTFMSEEEEERRKIPPSSKKKKKRGGEKRRRGRRREYGSRNNGAHTERRLPHLPPRFGVNGTSPCPLSHPTTTSVFVFTSSPAHPSAFPHSPAPPNAVFFREQRGPVALAAPLSITNYSLFSHFSSIFSGRREVLRFRGGEATSFFQQLMMIPAPLVVMVAFANV